MSAGTKVEKQKWGCEEAGTKEKIVTTPGGLCTGAQPCQPSACACTYGSTLGVL